MSEKSKLSLNLEALRERKLILRDRERAAIHLGLANGVNTIVTGAPGSGKTTAALLEVENYNKGSHKAVYVNCASSQTMFGVLSEIIDQVNASFHQKILIPSRSNFDLGRRLKVERGRHGEPTFVVLDHLDSISEPKAVDLLMEIGFKLVLVADNARALGRVSPLARSYFAYTVEFPDYTEEDRVRILRDKAKGLLGDGCFQNSLIAKLARLSNGNIGYGETLLVASVLKAVSDGRGCVEEGDVPEIGKPDRLQDDQKLILDILAEKRSLPSGALYRAYCGRLKYPKSVRTFRDYMRDLCQQGKVKAIGTNRGRIFELIPG